MMQILTYNAPSREVELNKRFKQAKRHSRAVTFYKIIIPLSIVIIAVLIYAFQLVSPLFNKYNANVDGYRINGTRISMLSPNLNGFTKDNKPYRVRAEHSEQDVKTPSIVDLFDMQGEFSLSDGGWATIKSVEGTMQTDKDIIEFRKKVTVTTTNDQFFTTSEAVVNARTGTIFAPKTVELRSKTSELVADSMDFQDNGQVIIFMGNVKGFFFSSSASSALKVEIKE